MNIKNIATLGLSTFVFAGLACGQTTQNKQISPSYIESCAQNQAQVHQKVKKIPADQFRSFCECTSQQLMGTLSSTQVDELNQSNKRPAWLKSAEDLAGKSCLKMEPKTQV